MRPSKITILQKFQSLIPQLSNNRSLYQLASSFFYDGPDESSITTLIFTRQYFDQSIENYSEYEQNEFYNFDNNFCDHLQSYAMNNELSEEFYISKEIGDYIQIKISDSLIYITIYYSGQF